MWRWSRSDRIEWCRRGCRCNWRRGAYWFRASSDGRWIDRLNGRRCWRWRGKGRICRDGALRTVGEDVMNGSDDIFDADLRFNEIAIGAE